jgi:hypothetical protein
MSSPRPDHDRSEGQPSLGNDDDDRGDRQYRLGCDEVPAAKSQKATRHRPASPAGLPSSTPHQQSKWDHDEPASDSSRFTLLGLLVLMTIASVVLAIGIRLPPPVFAGVAGLVVLVSLAFSSLAKNSPALVVMIWWVLMAIYLLAVVFALMQS